MKRILVLVVAGCLLVGVEQSCQQKTEMVQMPVTKKVEVRDTLHGVELVDPYRWLEDQNSPGTREWIKEQNRYTHAMLDPLPGREQLRARLTELMKIDYIGMPVERGGRYFLFKRRADQDQSVLYMREGLEGNDVELIDPNPMSADRTTSITLLDVIADGTLLAYGIRRGGEDELTVKLFDVDKRVELPDSLPKGRYFGLSLLPDRSGIFYSVHGKEGSRVYFHKMGTDSHNDRLIFGEGYGPEKGIGVGLSDDGKYLLITVFYGSAGKKNEIYVQNLKTGGEVIPIVNDIEANFYPEIAGDRLYLQTNWKAPRWRVLQVPLKNPVRSAWKEIIPESDGVIEGISAAGGRLFVNYLENVVSRVRVFTDAGKPIDEIKFDVLGSVGGISGRWSRKEAFFTFTSFHVPTTIYRLDTETLEKTEFARLAVPVNTENIEVEQVWYKSKDNTSVPMFLVHKKGLAKSGDHPTLLTGYGGFNVSLTPYFSATAVVWVEHGGVFAMPNLRGGGEFGEQWHEAGMLDRKQNVFDDFIAAAEWLIEKGYTNPDKLSISGGSNGGLLVGAALTQRPDLFKAVVCSYPLLDMIRYHKFLIARFWVPEYGSAENPEQFKYLLRYSPYHNVKHGESYPAVLFITGDADTRVAPLHARKMTALLQEANASDNPILLLYDTKTGHSGGMPVSKQIEDATDMLMFLFWRLGVKVRAQ